MKQEYILFAGVNGAGKTTLFRCFSYEEKPLRVNSDEILIEQGGDWRNAADQGAAMKEAVRRMREYMDKKASFQQETTLTGSSILPTIRKAKEAGYCVKMYYVGLESADLAVERVAQRVQKGGHGIKEEDIRRRYEHSLKNLKKAILLCDFVRIYDNTTGYISVAAFRQGIQIDGGHIWTTWLRRALGMEEAGERRDGTCSVSGKKKDSCETTE